MSQTQLLAPDKVACYSREKLRRLYQRNKMNLAYLASTCAFLMLWHIVAEFKLLGSFLPAPSAVATELIRLSTTTLASKSLFGHLWASLHRVLLGWSIAVVVAIPFGILMGLNEYARAVMKPIFDLLKPMPPISWISLSILWFGLGEQSMVFIIAVGSFVPCALNAYNGIRLIDPALYDVARMLGANRRQELMEVTLHSIIPALFAGLQISLSIAWSCVLAAELVGARSGMGFIIILGMGQLKPAMIVAGMLVIAMVAFLISAVMGKLEKIVCPWQREISA